MRKPLGAEIEGIDLTDVSDKNFNKINKLLLEHKVIFFRNQPITKEQQIALAERVLLGMFAMHPCKSAWHKIEVVPLRRPSPTAFADCVLYPYEPDDQSS